MTFKEYYTLHPELLDESPMRTGYDFSEPLVDNIALNTENTKESVLSLPVVGNYALSDHVLNCHRDPYEGGTKFQDYWASPREMTCLHFVFEHSGSGLVEKGVWQHRLYKGVARMLFFGFYLKHFSFVQSDKQHSTQGEKYWRKMVEYGIKNGYKATVTLRGDNSERDLSDGDLGGLWGKEADHSDLQIKIYAK